MACRYKIGDAVQVRDGMLVPENLFTVRVFCKFWEVKENVEK